MQTTVAADNAANRLEKFSHTALPGNRVQVSLDFAGAAPQPISFSTDNPARIVLDFPNTAISLAKKSQDIGIGAVQGLTVVESSERVRVVLNLVRLVPFDIELAGNKLLIIVTNSRLATASSTIGKVSATPKTPVSTTPTSSTIAAGTPSIQNIDFHRNSDGTGQVDITLSDPTITVNMERKGKEIELIFRNASLPEKLDRRLDVVDFATPASVIDTSAKGNDVYMKITAEGNFDHSGVQLQNVYSVQIKKIIETEKEATKRKDPVFTGTKVNFNFQNIEVRTALMLLTDFPGINLNLVASERVTGTMALRLKNVPWDQALQLILDANELGQRQVGNVMLIDKKAIFEERERRELAALAEIKKLEPVRTELIQVNYSKAKAFETLIKANAADKKQSLLSDRGTVSVDDRTNTLIIQDTADRLADMRSLIKALDTAVRQVLIESKVVIADDSFSRNLGVKFGYSANRNLGSGYGAVIGGKNTGDVTYSGGTAFTTGTAIESYMVNLPANPTTGTAGTIGLAIGKIGSYLLQLELSALENEGRGEIISSPRVITANQKKASILQGREFPVAGVAGVGATAAPTFKEAFLRLDVTPQITPDDRVIMDLKVTKNDLLSTAGDISRREVETQVLVDNGETVVLGGVYEQNKRSDIARVPFFGDLPLVGNLFKRRENTDTKAELLIFVTPKIVTETS